MISTIEAAREARRQQGVKKILEKDLCDMTPYERGYLAGVRNIMEGEDRSEDSYFASLSQDDRTEYDLGFYDGRNGLTLRGLEKETPDEEE